MLGRWSWNVATFAIVLALFSLSSVLISEAQGDLANDVLSESASFFALGFLIMLIPLLVLLGLLELIWRATPEDWERSAVFVVLALPLWVLAAFALVSTGDGIDGVQSINFLIAGALLGIGFVTPSEPRPLWARG